MRQGVGYRSNNGIPIKYSLWLLEGGCQKVLLAMVFIRSLSGSYYHTPSIKVGPWMGVDNISHACGSLFFRAIGRSKVV